MQKIKKQEGFNLIELLVVMAIIAVLIALVIAAINIARRAARNTDRRNTAQTIKASLEDYYARNKQYPNATVTGATALTTLSTTLSITPALTDPNNDEARFCYKRGATGTAATTQAGKYVLRVRMEGSPGTSPNCTAATDADSEDFSIQ